MIERQDTAFVKLTSLKSVPPSKQFFHVSPTLYTQMHINVNKCFSAYACLCAGLCKYLLNILSAWSNRPFCKQSMCSGAEKNAKDTSSKLSQRAFPNLYCRLHALFSKRDIHFYNVVFSLVLLLSQVPKFMQVTCE